jgi:lysophospholipase L1-like esterase
MSIVMPRTVRSAAATAIAGLALAALVLTTGHAGGDDDGGGRPQADVDRSATPARSAYPSSMDALGASVTVGFNTDCPDGWTDCPDNSWSTGANPAVDSVYLRLLVLNPRLKDHNANDAERGTAMVALDGQADSAVQRGVDLVTIAMGTNDACGRRTGVMTDVSEFRDEFRRAVDTLTSGLPRARVHVVSIPDLYRRWETFHTVPRVMKAWSAQVPFCSTVFTRPTSNAPTDVHRRAAVRARILEYNGVLTEVCARYPRCTTDGGAAFRAPIVLTEFSTHDYWHPNIAGQAALAKLVWDTLGY